MPSLDPRNVASELYSVAKAFIRIDGVLKQSAPWCRNVKDGDHRRGPWLSATYNIVDQEAWDRRASCMYLVGSSDGGIRYVGVSKNRLKDRWRLSPGFDSSLINKLPGKQLFHSQCWRQMEAEFVRNSLVHFEVRVLFADTLGTLANRLGLVGGFGAPVPRSAAAEVYPMLIEKWLRKHRQEGEDGQGFFAWNAS